MKPTQALVAFKAYADAVRKADRLARHADAQAIANRPALADRLLEQADAADDRAEALYAEAMRAERTLLARVEALRAAGRTQAAAILDGRYRTLRSGL
jgi:hypothetical protein